MKTLMLTLALTLLTTTASGQGPVTVEGEGIVHCELRTHATTTNCDTARRPPARMELTTGTQSAVTLTVTWVASTRDAENLSVVLLGNAACYSPGDPDCHRRVAQGRSPLTLTLAGAAASNATLVASVGGADVCKAADPVLSCEAAARLVIDQRFRYVWTLT